MQTHPHTIAIVARIVACARAAKKFVAVAAAILLPVDPWMETARLLHLLAPPQALIPVPHAPTAPFALLYSLVELQNVVLEAELHHQGAAVLL